MDDITRSRLYEAYATTHAGLANADANRLAFEFQILPHIPRRSDARVLDLGCGQGELVRQFIEHGYRDTRGIDVSPEQVALAHKAGLETVVLGDYRTDLERNSVDVITATDFLEHLTRREVLEALDAVLAALRPRGTFIVRTPNLASPFGGGYRYGDVTHETSFTDRSLRQLAAAAGFADIEVFSCPPVAHGAKSLARLMVWKLASGMMKLALAAETGQVRGHHVTQNILAVMRASA